MRKLVGPDLDMSVITNVLAPKGNCILDEYVIDVVAHCPSEHFCARISIETTEFRRGSSFDYGHVQT